MRNQAGFSLIEVLVSVTIIALLVGISAVALRSAATRARQTADLSKMRQHQMVMLTYSADFRDYWPYFVNPQSDAQTASSAVTGTVSIAPYFGACATWPIALADRYYGGNPYSDIFYAAEDLRTGTRIGNPFYYSCTLFASSAFWNSRTREGPSQYGPTKVTEVSFPGKKIVIMDLYPQLRAASEGRFIDVSRAFGTADGHVETLMASQIRAGMPSGEGGHRGSLHPADFAHGLHTLDGVRGQDIP